MGAAANDPAHLGGATQSAPHALDYQLQRAREAQLAWASLSIGSRARRLQQLATRIRSQAEALVTLIHQDMGKLLEEAHAEVQRSASWLDHLALHGERWLSTEPVNPAKVWHDPQGTVLAVTPWNYPLWQLCRPLAPALLAGNAVVFKPSPSASNTTRWLLNACQGLLPTGLVSDLPSAQEYAITALRHPLTNMLVLTGSEHAGRTLAALAGEQLKPAVLELGGNNPLLVLADADIEAAAAAAAHSRCYNAGQSCTAAKRMIAAATVADRFREALQAALQQYRPAYNLAPLARADLKVRAHKQVVTSMAAGARCLLGGNAERLPGNVFPPTLLDQIQPDHPAFAEEVFAPVATLSVAQNEATLLALARGVKQRLVASIWTEDVEHALHLARKLNTGVICHNQRPSSQLDQPFEGRGTSGFGSTLGPAGLLAFTRPAVWVGS